MPYQQKLARYLGVSRERATVIEALALDRTIFESLVQCTVEGEDQIEITLAPLSGNPIILTERSGQTTLASVCLNPAELIYEDLDKLIFAGDSRALRSALEAVMQKIAKVSLIEFDENSRPSFFQTEQLKSEYEQYRSCLGYDSSAIVRPTDYVTLEKQLSQTPIQFLHNESCAGKSFCALTLADYSAGRFIFKPNWSRPEHLNTLIGLALFARDTTFVFDDLQSSVRDTERVIRACPLLLPYLKRNNSRIILVAWESFYRSLAEPYRKIFALIGNYSLDTAPLIASLSNRLMPNLPAPGAPSQRNIAVLDALHKVSGRSASLQDLSSALLNIDPSNWSRNRKLALYALAVLGAYEFHPTIEQIERICDFSVGDVLSLLPNIKRFEEGRIYLGHRAVCESIAVNLSIKDPPERAEIITKYIGLLRPEQTWRAVSQIISHDGRSQSGRLLPLWNIVASFEQQLEQQTKQDPHWKKAPSSLFFVTRAAMHLGFLEKYGSVAENFVNIYGWEGQKLTIAFDGLITKTDFATIKEKMMTQDQSIPASGYELGNSIETARFHENWLLGFGLGSPEAFRLFNREAVHRALIEESRSRQETSGYWYPRRVPWVTARILIGAGQAGLSCTNSDWVERGCKALLSMRSSDGFWYANTGGWNNKYETTALALEALKSAHYIGEEAASIYSEISDLLVRERKQWMVKNAQVTPESQITMVDGVTTACVLLKNGLAETADTEMIEYLVSVEKVYEGEFFIRSGAIDLNHNQSCALAQVPSFLIEAGWSVLASDIRQLLNEYINRANEARAKVFISYLKGDDVQKTNAKELASFLSTHGFEVLFDADLGGGQDSFEFMKNIKSVDKVLLLGSKEYVQQCSTSGTGLWYELNLLNERASTGDRSFLVPAVWRCNFRHGVPDGFIGNNGVELVTDWDDRTKRALMDLLRKSTRK